MLNKPIRLSTREKILFTTKSPMYGYFICKLQDIKIPAFKN